eukprot:scpid82327/ scgid33899/ Serine/threonine-protein kinase 40; Serine/threonine-protein kinase lyk4
MSLCTRANSYPFFEVKNLNYFGEMIMLGPWRLCVPTAGYGKSRFPCVKFFLAVHSQHKSEYVLMKTADLTCSDAPAALNMLRAEEAILKHLHSRSVTGIVLQHGLYYSHEDEEDNEQMTGAATPGVEKMVGLALTNYIASDYDVNSVHWTTLWDLVGESHVLGQLEEKASVQLIRRIAAVLLAVHEAGVVMLQLSLHDVAYNITTEEIRLTNFSHALMVGDKELVDLDADTLQSITTPPDMTADMAYPVRKADVWSLGLMLHKIISCNMPHEMENAQPQGLHGVAVLDNGWQIPCEPALHQYTRNFISLLGWPFHDSRASSEEAFAIAEMCTTFFSRMAGEGVEHDESADYGENEDDEEEARCFTQGDDHQSDGLDMEEMMYQILAQHSYM